MIFEGDVLKYADISSDEWIMERERIIGIVKWRDNKCGFSPQQIKQNHKRGHYFAYWDQIEDVEIIDKIVDTTEGGEFRSVEFDASNTSTDEDMEVHTLSAGLEVGTNLSVEA